MSPKRSRSESVEEDLLDEGDGLDNETSPDLATVTGTVPPPPPESVPPAKNRRGRPPGSKNKRPAGASGSNGEAGPSEPPPIKRPRGRPRKPRTAEQLAAEAAKAALPKRPRGRPKKQKVEASASQAGQQVGSSTTIASTSAPAAPAAASPATIDPTIDRSRQSRATTSMTVQAREAVD